MNINDIIGKGKDFEPPFKVEHGDNYYNPVVKDSRGYVIACIWGDAYKDTTPQKANTIADHLCELLNRKHKGSNQRMCLRDRSKVCNLCHDCDVDVLNPGNRIQSR